MLLSFTVWVNHSCGRIRICVNQSCGKSFLSLSIIDPACFCLPFLAHWQSECRCSCQMELMLFLQCSYPRTQIILNFLAFADEHANETAGGSQLLQSPELWQRLQQQQPSRWHPGFLPGVHVVISLRQRCFHLARALITDSWKEHVPGLGSQY